jgi:hypothetical protein
MTPDQKLYFDKMLPGQRLSINEVRDADLLVSSGKEYIDAGGFAYFSDDYTEFVKDEAWICPRSLTVLLDELPVT